MELSLNIGLSEKKSNTAALFKTKSAKVILFVLLTVLFFCGLAYAGSDDGALGDIWSYMSESMTGAPGKILAAAMLISSVYFSVLKPNPGTALVSLFMMLVMANGEKIISTFMDAGVPL
jgi:hypothetical protein